MITIIDDFLPEDLSLSLLGVFGDDVPAAEACLTVPYDRLDPRRPGVGPLRMAMHRTRLHVAEVVRSMLDLPRVEPESTCLRRVAPGFAPRVKPGAWWMVAQAVIAPVIQAEWAEVGTLDDTARGAGGFGSTGRG